MVEQIGLVLFLLYYIPLISALNVSIHTIICNFILEF